MAAKRSPLKRRARPAEKVGIRPAAEAIEQPGAAKRIVDDSCLEKQVFAPSAPRRARIDYAQRAVVFTQRLGGTMILQTLPLNGFDGVEAELQVCDRAANQPTVRLVLCHPTNLYSVELASDLDLIDAVAEWRKWADKLSLGMVLADPNGAKSLVREHLGAVPLSFVQPRRLGAKITRRPRFSKRRGVR